MRWAWGGEVQDVCDDGRVSSAEPGRGMYLLCIIDLTDMSSESQGQDTWGPGQGRAGQDSSNSKLAVENMHAPPSWLRKLASLTNPPSHRAVMALDLLVHRIQRLPLPCLDGQYRRLIRGTLEQARKAQHLHISPDVPQKASP